MAAKFMLGNEVRIINYGRLVMNDKQYPGAQEILGIWVRDVSPQLVGQVGVIEKVRKQPDTADVWQYAVRGIKGKYAWYEEHQLDWVIDPYFTKGSYRRRFWLSIRRAKNCMYGRRNGYLGKIIAGYSVCLRLFNKTIL